MRLNKVSELIHNSTDHQNLESASVSVHFEEIVDSVTIDWQFLLNYFMACMFLKSVVFFIELITHFDLCCWLTFQDNGEYEVVPGSDFVITRAAFRDNSSKYYINNRASNFTEVTKKLKGKGVDLDNNRFLILQVSPISLFLFLWYISIKYDISLVLSGWSRADFTDEAKSSRTSWWGIPWIFGGYNWNHQICWNDWWVKQAVSVFFFKFIWWI